MRMRVKWAAALAVILALSILLSSLTLIFPQLSRGKRLARETPGKGGAPRGGAAKCFLAARNGSGYTVHLSAPLNLTCPARWGYEVAAWRGYRVRVFLNGGALPPSGSLVLRGNETLTVRVYRVNVTLRLLANASAPYMVNGSRREGNATIRVPLGSQVNLTALPGAWRGFMLEPLNGSVVLEATGNLTVRLYWAARCSGVAVESNVAGAWALVNGRNVTLPYCVEPPVKVRGSLELSLNGTYSWWLAWYWLEQGGSRRWWSPTLNGSELRVEKPANVTLHYYAGLRSLRYVQAVVKWPEPFFNGSCPLSPGKPIEDLEVKDGWVHVYNPRTCAWKDENVRVGFMFVTLKLPREVGTVVFEVWVPEWNTHYYDGAQIEYFLAPGGTVVAGLYYPQLNHDAGRPYTPVVIAMNGYSSSIISGRDGWVKSDVIGGPGPYGFKCCHDFWRLPAGGQYLYVAASCYYRTYSHLYVRVAGVTP